MHQQVLPGYNANEFQPENEIQDVLNLRQDYEKLRLAYELGRSIGLEVDIDLLLKKILTKAFELIPADRGVMLLIEDGRPSPKVARTRDGKAEQIILSRSILNEVVKKKAGVLSSDATMDARFNTAQSVILQGIRSTMTVPLIHHDALLGIMHLDSMVATNAFAEKDLQLFSAVGAQAAAAIHNAFLAREIEQEARTRAQFQRLLSPNLVDQVVAGKLTLDKGGARNEVTLLFADIRGFTSMSESRPPEAIVQMLNDYFERMVDVLFRHEGTLDKFVGDEIIGIFGAPVSVKNAELKAACCALEMMASLKPFNLARIAAGETPIQIGIGINTGQVVTGAIGSSRALQYTAIGDAMNTASRLCSVAKPGQIVLSGSTYARIRSDVDVEALAPVALKGKSEPLPIFELQGLTRGEALSQGLHGLGDGSDGMETGSTDDSNKADHQGWPPENTYPA